MHIAQLISDFIYCLQARSLQDTQWTRRSPTGPWDFLFWLQNSVISIECPSSPTSSFGLLLTRLSSRSITCLGRHRARHHSSRRRASSRQLQTHCRHLQSPPLLTCGGCSTVYDMWLTSRRPTIGVRYGWMRVFISTPYVSRARISALTHGLLLRSLRP